MANYGRVLSLFLFAVCIVQCYSRRTSGHGRSHHRDSYEHRYPRQRYHGGRYHSKYHEQSGEDNVPNSPNKERINGSFDEPVIKIEGNAVDDNLDKGDIGSVDGLSVVNDNSPTIQVEGLSQSDKGNFMGTPNILFSHEGVYQKHGASKVNLDGGHNTISINGIIPNKINYKAGDKSINTDGTLPINVDISNNDNLGNIHGEVTKGIPDIKVNGLISSAVSNIMDGGIGAVHTKGLKHNHGELNGMMSNGKGGLHVGDIIHFSGDSSKIGIPDIMDGVNGAVHTKRLPKIPGVNHEHGELNGIMSNGNGGLHVDDIIDFGGHSSKIDIPDVKEGVTGAVHTNGLLKIPGVNHGNGESNVKLSNGIGGAHVDDIINFSGHSSKIGIPDIKDVVNGAVNTNKRLPKIPVVNHEHGELNGIVSNGNDGLHVDDIINFGEHSNKIGIPDIMDSVNSAVHTNGLMKSPGVNHDHGELNVQVSNGNDGVHVGDIIDFGGHSSKIGIPDIKDVVNGAVNTKGLPKIAGVNQDHGELNEMLPNGNGVLHVGDIIDLGNSSGNSSKIGIPDINVNLNIDGRSPNKHDSDYGENHINVNGLIPGNDGGKISIDFNKPSNNKDRPAEPDHIPDHGEGHVHFDEPEVHNTINVDGLSLGDDKNRPTHNYNSNINGLLPGGEDENSDNSSGNHEGGLTDLGKPEHNIVVDGLMPNIHHPDTSFVNNNELPSGGPHVNVNLPDVHLPSAGGNLDNHPVNPDPDMKPQPDFNGNNIPSAEVKPGKANNSLLLPVYIPGVKENVNAGGSNAKIPAFYIVMINGKATLVRNPSANIGGNANSIDLNSILSGGGISINDLPGIISWLNSGAGGAAIGGGIGLPVQQPIWMGSQYPVINGYVSESVPVPQPIPQQIYPQSVSYPVPEPYNPGAPIIGYPNMPYPYPWPSMWDSVYPSAPLKVNASVNPGWYSYPPNTGLNWPSVLQFLINNLQQLPNIGQNVQPYTTPEHSGVSVKTNVPIDENKDVTHHHGKQGAEKISIPNPSGEPIEPSPIAPRPFKIVPVNPVPTEPALIRPEPVVPITIEPHPIEPLPIAPLPQPIEPHPIEPHPIEPLPITPIPQPIEPHPIEPHPIEPLPITPIPQPIEPHPIELHPIEPLPIAPLPQPIEPHAIEPLPIEPVATEKTVSIIRPLPDVPNKGTGPVEPITIERPRPSIEHPTDLSKDHEKSKEQSSRPEKERPDREISETERHEKERPDREIPETERHEKERPDRERLETERHEKDRHDGQSSERERSNRERTDRERSNRQRPDRERSDNERSDRERHERERHEKERSDGQRSDRERSESERLERERHEKERYEGPRSDRERSESGRLERERHAKDRRERGRHENERPEGEKPEIPNINTALTGETSTNEIVKQKRRPEPLVAALINLLNRILKLPNRMPSPRPTESKQTESLEKLLLAILNPNSEEKDIKEMLAILHKNGDKNAPNLSDISQLLRHLFDGQSQPNLNILVEPGMDEATRSNLILLLNMLASNLASDYGSGLGYYDSMNVGNPLLYFLGHFPCDRFNYQSMSGGQGGLQQGLWHLLSNMYGTGSINTIVLDRSAEENEDTKFTPSLKGV